ncbi:MAG: hypothetical protein P8Y17_01985 [Patescibacteria group bacterium]
MDQTENIINVPKIEALMPEQKALFKTLIEATVSLVESGNESQPEFENLSGTAPEVKDVLQKCWCAMIARQKIDSIINLWKGIGTPSSAEQFEAIIESPHRKLAGFHLKGNEYPIHPPEILEGKDLLVLGEPEVKEIYLSLGGSREKAKEMFPTTE